MADKEEKIATAPEAMETPSPAPPAPAPETSPANPEKTAAKPFKSKGWKIHNEMTYRGIDWLLNSSIGVAFSFWQARTPSGEKWFGNPVGKFFNVVLKPVLKSETTRAEGAKWGRDFAGIMAGGFAIIPIMMFMENRERKKKVVRWLDEKCYGKEAVQNDPKFEESYCEIDKEPKKGFLIGMASRLVAIAPIITAVSIPASNIQLRKWVYDPIGDRTKKVATKIGIKPNKWLLEKGDMEHIASNPALPKEFVNNWDKLHRTIGLDFGLTIIYAIFHEIAYKSLAAMGMKKTKSGKPVASPECTEPALPLAEASSPTAEPQKKWAAREEAKPERTPPAPAYADKLATAQAETTQPQLAM